MQFPFELRDVLVSDPEKVDAVVQSSNRVFLIAKKLGQTNAFFFDTKGQQILTLEIAVGADLERPRHTAEALRAGLQHQTRDGRQGHRPDRHGAHAARSKRAADIACQFAQANVGIAQQPNIAVSARATASATQTHAPEQYEPRPAQASRGSRTKLVINLLTVEGEEQVMLKVTVAEVQRTILKQFGINVGAAINSGNFSTALLTENALAADGRRGPRQAADPGIGTAGSTPAQPSRARRRHALQLQPRSSGSRFGNSGVDELLPRGNTQSPAPCVRSSATA